MGWREDVTFGNLAVTGRLSYNPALVSGASITMKPKVYFVSRNVTRSGDGTSWGQAFKTIGEAIAKVNQDYTYGYVPDNGRNRMIVIGEGWYSETGLTLTASDVTIIANGSGSNIADGTVLYGSLTAAGWDAGALVPALTITGSSNIVQGLGLMNSASGLYPCVSVGVSGSTGPSNNMFLGCFFPRDVADAYTYAIVDYGNEGCVIDGCRFSQSAKTGGILIASNGVVNPVNDVVRNNVFVGTPMGVNQTAGHNTLVHDNMFMDSTDDRPDTCDYPMVCEATSMLTYRNVSFNTNRADMCTGAGTILDLENVGSDTVNT